MLINILKDVNCNNKLTNIKLKQYLCDYFTFNPTYKINKNPLNILGIAIYRKLQNSFW